MRKAQTALEYLMTYGWAILIIIIVGASLYALGVFSPGTWTGKRTTGFAQFQVVDFKLDVDETFKIMYGNRLGKTITLKQINATYKNEVCEIYIGDLTIGPNTQNTESGDCTTEWGNLDIRTSYSILVDFYYEDPDSGFEHIDSGTLFGAVEP